MAQMSSRLLQEVSGSAGMALLSWSYLLLREEVPGKRLVWLVLTFTVNWTACR